MTRVAAKKLKIETNIVSGEIVDSTRLPMARSRSTAAGLAARPAFTACPKPIGRGAPTLAHDVDFGGGADLPVYVRVTQCRRQSSLVESHLLD